MIEQTNILLISKELQSDAIYLTINNDFSHIQVANIIFHKNIKREKSKYLKIVENYFMIYK